MHVNLIISIEQRKLLNWAWKHLLLIIFHLLEFDHISFSKREHTQMLFVFQATYFFFSFTWKSDTWCWSSVYLCVCFLNFWASEMPFAISFINDILWEKKIEYIREKKPSVSNEIKSEMPFRRCYLPRYEKPMIFN